MLRFSRIAFAAVATLAITGVTQAVRLLPAPAALAVTAFGRLLLLKLALVALMIALGALARRRIRRRSAPTVERVAVESRNGARTSVLERPVQPAGDRLRRGLVAELALGVAILALTSALVTLPVG